MKKMDSLFLVMTYLLAIATFWMLSLYLPPLSQLEGASSLGQIVAFIPAIFVYPVAGLVLGIQTIVKFWTAKKQAEKSATILLYGVFLLAILVPIYLTLGNLLPSLPLALLIPLLCLFASINCYLAHRILAQNSRMKGK